MLKLFSKDAYSILFLIIVGVAVLNLFTRSMPGALYFVDAGRFAEIARNLSENGQFLADFAFPKLYVTADKEWLINIPPLHANIIALLFRLFGTSDRMVIFLSNFFFLASVPLLFLIAKKIFNFRVAFFSGLFYLFSFPLLNNAKDGAAEPLFIFELLLISLFILVNKKWSFCLAGIICALAIFTKLQSYLFVPIFVGWILLAYRKDTGKILYFFLGMGLPLLLHKFGLLFGYYRIEVPTYLSFQQTSMFPGDDLARSDKVSNIDTSFLLRNLGVFLSKFFYNMYNFYKSIFSFDSLLPQFANPVVVVAYLLSLLGFLRKESREVRIFRGVVLVMFLGSLGLAAATSPHIRYIHYVLPFVIILGVDFMERVFQQLNPRRETAGLLLVLTAFFILPFLGITILDARFRSRVHNLNQPYAQKVLGEVLGDLTNKDAVVVTNLDTWGSWYGNRKTILIPLNLGDFSILDRHVGIGAVFLTDYQRNNENHPLEGEWGMMFDTPEKIDNSHFIENFSLIREGSIPALEVYENNTYTYKLWIKK